VIFFTDAREDDRHFEDVRKVCRTMSA